MVGTSALGGHLGGRFLPLGALVSWTPLAMVLLATCRLEPPGPLYPVAATVYRFSPPPAYAIWSEEVAQCVAELARTNTSFTVVDTTTTVADVVWLAVATERGDATFSWGVKSGYYAFRAGPPGHDTIALAAPLLLVPRVIKHEIMHIKVDSPREDVWLGHGLPWGLCEYL